VPRWRREDNDRRRDLLGFPVTKTCVMDSSQATAIEGASQLAELEEQLGRAARSLQQFNQHHPVIHTGGKLPPGAILATDVIDDVLCYIGYRLEDGGKVIRFRRPLPCRSPSP
jgi:hypothetical protein